MPARHVTPDDLPMLEDALMAAFRDDPLNCWLYPDGGESTRGWFAVALRAGLRRGHTYRSGDGTGAAIWAPPGVRNLDRDEGAQIARLTEEHYGAGGVARLTAVAEATSAAHPREPHFYLFILGAAVPGRGTGAELVAPALRICDEQGWPAYLESSNPRNVTFYERQGFRSLAPIVPDGGPPLLGMWREPASR